MWTQLIRMWAITMRKGVFFFFKEKCHRNENDQNGSTPLFVECVLSIFAKIEITMDMWLLVDIVPLGKTCCKGYDDENGKGWGLFGEGKK